MCIWEWRLLSRLKCCWKPQTIRTPLALKTATDTWEHLLLHPPIQRIDIWARVRSPGPLMADKAGAGGNTIHADEQPARRVEGRERRGSGERKKGSVESGGRWKQLPPDHRVKMDQRSRGAWWHRLRMKTEKRREESRGHSSRVEEKEEEQEELRASPPSRTRALTGSENPTKERIIGRQTSTYKRKRTVVTYAIKAL